MLAKKFRLPIQQWMKKRGAKIITKKGNFFIVKTAPNGLTLSRFGVIISAKAIKKASQRNYLKRTIFNLIRLDNLHKKSGLDFLITAQPLVSRAAKKEIEKELKTLLT